MPQVAGIGDNGHSDTQTQMNRALASVLWMGITLAPIASQADEVYRLCGPSAAGFIRAGGSMACIKRTPDSQFAEERPEPSVKAGTNKKVDESLNGADLSFRRGFRDAACSYVRNAITFDIDNYGGVASSQAQRDQIKEYAARCNLRY